ncbi:MAG: response regulator [bacterium]
MDTYKVLALVADDDSDTRDLLKLVLESDRYSAIEVTNGKELIEKARAENPSLIISDVMMPYMNGYEAIIKLRENPLFQKTPVLFISCIVTNGPLVQQMKKMSNATFMEKPFTPQTLLKTINSLLISQ